jgi:hypothetical protein
LPPSTETVPSVTESGRRAAPFFSGSLLTVAVVVVVVFCGVSCAAAEKTPIIRADTAKLHFTQFFTRAIPPSDCLKISKFVDA